MTTSAFDIFSEVIDLNPADRPTALTEACGDDEALRDEVESLLRAHDTAEAGFLDGAALGGAAREYVAATSVHHRADERVGPYRLLREIGAGGMGSVWLAERADGEFEQRVAIKLIQQGMNSADILHRFRRERQVLAGLAHPNIARLLDGGTTDDDLPYLVMEHVDGRRIDTWCDAQRATIDERVRLFLKVCAAVHEAHRNLVVHRDLKPGNILVTKDGTPKLLDFGIAGLLAGETRSLDVTMTHDRRLTPAYASPEQVRGGTITTATDVYSLGVILYELLTGRRPYDLTGTSAAETERAICETNPTRPAVALTTTSDGGRSMDRDAASSDEVARRRSTDVRSLQRTLSGDLEKVMLMALRKEPERRYSSVEAFAEDLRRALAGLPVAAQLDTVGYRVQRFIGRHRVGTGVAAGVALLLTGAVITIIALMIQARSASTLAEEEAFAANTVSSYLRDMVGSIDPAIAQGRDVTLFREMLDGLAERLQREAVGSPRVRGELHLTVGRAHHAISEYEASELHLREAVLLRREGLDPLELAEALLALSRTMRYRSDYDTAAASAREALTIRRAHLPPGDRGIAEAMTTLGVTLWASGEYDEAEELLQSSIELLRRDPDHSPKQLGSVLREYGALLADRRQHEEAEPLLIESRELLAKAHGEDHPVIATIEARLGWSARRAGRLEEAAVHYRRALDIRERVYEPNHSAIGYGLTGLAAVLEDLEQFEEAESMYRRALEIDVVALGPRHTEVGTVHNNLGGLYRKMNRFDESVVHLRKSIEIYTEVRGADDLWTSYPWLNLSRTLLQADRPEEALEPVAIAIAIRENAVPPDHSELHVARVQHGLVLAAAGRGEEAAPILSAAVEGLEPQFGADHPLVIEARATLSTLADRASDGPS